MSRFTLLMLALCVLALLVSAQVEGQRPTPGTAAPASDAVAQAPTPARGAQPAPPAPPAGCFDPAKLTAAEKSDLVAFLQQL